LSRAMMSKVMSWPTSAAPRPLDQEVARRVSAERVTGPTAGTEHLAGSGHELVALDPAEAQVLLLGASRQDTELSDFSGVGSSGCSSFPDSSDSSAK
jgi:hypothetical protein